MGVTLKELTCKRVSFTRTNSYTLLLSSPTVVQDRSGASGQFSQASLDCAVLSLGNRWGHLLCCQRPGVERKSSSPLLPEIRRSEADAAPQGFPIWGSSESGEGMESKGISVLLLFLEIFPFPGKILRNFPH